MPKEIDLVPCSNCARKFYPSRLVVHMRGCKSKSTSPAKLRNVMKTSSSASQAANKNYST